MDTRQIKDIVVGDRYRKDLGNIKALAESIQMNGLLHPVVIDDDNNLIAGQRRLEALKRLGLTEVAVNVIHVDDPVNALNAQDHENTCRQDFTPTEMDAIRKALFARHREESRARMSEGGRLGGRGAGKLPDPDKGQVRDKIAAAVGTSPRNLDKIAKVVEAAEKNPDLKPVVEEMDRTGRVDPAYRAVTQQITQQPQRPSGTGAILRKLDRALEDILTWSEEVEQRIDEFDVESLTLEYGKRIDEAIHALQSLKSVMPSRKAA